MKGFEEHKPLKFNEPEIPVFLKYHLILNLIRIAYLRTAQSAWEEIVCFMFALVNFSCCHWLHPNCFFIKVIAKVIKKVKVVGHKSV